MRALIFEAELDSINDNIINKGGKDAQGLFTNAIKFANQNIECDVVFPNRDDYQLLNVEQLQCYNYIFWSGGSLNAYDKDENVLRQIAQAKLVFKSKIPFFGSCFGLQIAVMASGGMVGRNQNGLEVGVATNITINEAGKNHPMLKNRTEPFASYCYHNSETVTLPENATILAYNQHSKVQAIEINYDGGTFWGVQYHPEFDFETMRADFVLTRDELSEQGFISPDISDENIIDDLMNNHKNDLQPQTVYTEIINFINYYS